MVTKWDFGMGRVIWT